MKVLLIGTGALGSFYGAKIAHGGGDITFLSRGTAYEKIKSEGIELVSDLEDSFVVPVKILNALSNTAEYDLTIVATKSYDVDSLVDHLPDSLFKSSYFLTLQNGLMSEDLFLTKIKPDRLLPATAFIGVRKSDANTVHHSGGGRFQFGLYKGGKREGFVEELCHLLEQSRIDVQYSEDIMMMKWGKLVWNAAYNPLSTITQSNLGGILNSPFGIEILRESMNETVAVAKKFGYELSEAFIQKQIDLPKNLYSFKTSMLQDFLNGKQIEIEAMLGDLIKKADDVGVATPTNKHFYQILQILLNQRNQEKKSR